jgi:predicted ferric reductase
MIIGASQFAWHVARVSGLLAWLLLTTAVGWGLLLSTRALGRRPSRPWLLEMHRYLSMLALWFVGLHLLALLADTYIHFTVLDFLVPLHSAWRPVALLWGILAMYTLIAVESTSLVRDRLPRDVWHRIHLSSFVAFVFATVHGLLAGTDRGNPLVITIALIGCGEVLALLAVRLTAHLRVGRVAASS